MRRLHALYTLTLALLVGGNVLYTFLATPVIFARFERDLAGRVVAAMMPYYFRYDLVLVLVAVALFALAVPRRAPAYRASAALLGVTVVTAVAVVFWLYPAMLEVRGQVASFAADAPMTPARQAFRRLHGISSVLNLLLLAVGTALLLLAPRTAPPRE